MAVLTLRQVDDQLIRALKQRAARHGRSAEAEHRLILRRLDRTGKPWSESCGSTGARSKDATSPT